MAEHSAAIPGADISRQVLSDIKIYAALNDYSLNRYSSLRNFAPGGLDEDPMAPAALRNSRHNRRVDQANRLANQLNSRGSDASLMRSPPVTFQTTGGQTTH
jgi:hypothetical protein